MIRVRAVQLRRRIVEGVRWCRLVIVAGYALIGLALLTAGVWNEWGLTYGLLAGGVAFLVMAFEPESKK